MAQFKVLGASSHFEKGKEYKPGDIFRSDDPLTDMFPNKFEKVMSRAEHAPPANAKPYLKYSNKHNAMKGLEPGEEAVPDEEARAEAEEEMEHSGEEQHESHSLGRNISSKFPKAKDGNLMVFKSKDKKYFVANKDKPGEALHEEGFTNQTEVNKFIKETSS